MMLEWECPFCGKTTFAAAPTLKLTLKGGTWTEDKDPDCKLLIPLRCGYCGRGVKVWLPIEVEASVDGNAGTD